MHEQRAEEEEERYGDEQTNEHDISGEDISSMLVPVKAMTDSVGPTLWE